MTMLFDSQPTEFWIIAPPKGSIDRANVLQPFESRRAAIEHAQEISQRHNEHYLVYRVELHGIVLPKAAIFEERKP